MTQSIDAKIWELTMRAKKGDATAPYRLGVIHREADRGEEDRKASLRWFKKAAQIDCVPAHFEIANAYFKGLGTRPSRKKGLEALLTAGKKYDQRAFFPLYEFYAEDKKDRESGGREAHLWLYRAAETRDPRAYLPLGRRILESYERGEEPEDAHLAVHWLQKAQEGGSAEASVILSRMCEEGILTPREPDKAYRHMKKAASRDFPESFLPFAKMCLRRSREDAGQFRRAMKYIKKAVKNNVPEAAYLLGIMYRRGSADESFDPQLSFFFIKKAASMNFAPAVHELATLYEEGRGVKADRRKAFSLVKKAAKAGYRPSMLKLAQMYESGDHARRDHEEAMRWLSLAGATEDNAQVYEGL